VPAMPAGKGAKGGKPAVVLPAHPKAVVKARPARAPEQPIVPQDAAPQVQPSRREQSDQDRCSWKATRDPLCRCTQCKKYEGNASMAVRETKRASENGSIEEVHSAIRDLVPSPWNIDPRPRDGATILSNRAPRELATMTLQDICPLPPSRHASDIREDLRMASLNAECRTAATLEDHLAEGGHLGQPNSLVTTELITAALHGTVKACTYWTQTLRVHLEERATQGDYTHNTVREALSDLEQLLPHAVCMNAAVPATIQLETFKSLRERLKNAQALAPANLRHIDSKTQITECLRIAHFAECMIQRGNLALLRQAMVATHTQTVVGQWHAIANGTRFQAIAAMSEYAIPLASALEVDLRETLTYIDSYVSTDPMGSVLGTRAGEAEQTVKALRRWQDEVVYMLREVGTPSYHPFNVEAEIQDVRQNVACAEHWTAFVVRLEKLCLDACATWIAQHKLLGGYNGYFGTQKPLVYLRSRYGAVNRVRELLVRASVEIQAQWEKARVAA
jgi:hypothetical protein